MRIAFAFANQVFPFGVVMPPWAFASLEKYGLGGPSGAKNFPEEQLHLAPGALGRHRAITEPFQTELVRLRIHEGVHCTRIGKGETWGRGRSLSFRLGSREEIMAFEENSVVPLAESSRALS